MNAREFFYLVCQMRSAQTMYFKTRDPNVLRAARQLENNVDREIKRVKDVLSSQTDSDTAQNFPR